MENNWGVCRDDDDDDDDDDDFVEGGSLDWDEEDLESGEGVSKNEAILRMAGILQKISMLLTFP